MTSNTDFIIVQKARKDGLYFRELVVRYQALVYRLAYKFLRNHTDSEEIVQETFIRLWKNLSKYKENLKLSTWLYKIASNLCLDHLKSKRRKQQLSETDLDNMDLSTNINPENILERKELMEIILEKAKDLTPKQKAVFILRDLEGLPGDEVAEVLNMKSGNVKSNLYYARIAMTKTLKELYHEL